MGQQSTPNYDRFAKLGTQKIENPTTVAEHTINKLIQCEWERDNKYYQEIVDAQSECLVSVGKYVYEFKVIKERADAIIQRLQIDGFYCRKMTLFPSFDQYIRISHLPME